VLVVDTNHVDATPAGEGRFTTGVWQELILDYQLDKGMRVHRFSYPAGEHSHWHTHDGEQSILVQSGRGWIKLEGDEGVELKPGDLVYVPKDKKHWHGATPNQVLVHLAFTASGGTAWHDKVTPEAYGAEFS
jgi:quercetin dioxygenase-like cupin family protein